MTENENVVIAKQNKWGDKGMVTRMSRQAYKSKAHETFLAKHAYTSKAQPGCRNGNQGYKKEIRL